MSSICNICCDNNICNEFKCNTCNNTLCLKCFKSISKPIFDIENTKQMIFKYNCPICRIEDNYNYNNFEKKEIIELVNSNILNIFNNYIFANDTDDFIRDQFKRKLQEITKKDEEILYLKEKLKNKDKEILDLKSKDNNEDILKLNCLKFIVENAKTKRIDKKILIPLYEKMI